MTTWCRAGWRLRQVGVSFEGVALARPSYGKLQRCPCTCVTCPPAGVREARVKGGLRDADLRASEGGLRGRLREVPKSGQWTPRKRSSEERSGGLYEVDAWRLCYTVEPISGDPEGGRKGAGTRAVLGFVLGLVLDPSWGSFWSSFWSSFGIILEVILEVTLETRWSDAS